MPPVGREGFQGPVAAGVSGMDMSVVRLWLLASQILLAAGAVAVVLGAVGTVRFTALRERLTVAEAISRRPPAPDAPAPEGPTPVIAPVSDTPPTTSVAVPAGGPAASAASLAQVTALRTENQTLKNQLAAAQKDLKAATEHAAQGHTPSSGPRSLTDAQKTRLLAALKAIPGPPNLDVLTLSDPEAAAYGDQFVRLIDQAGYRGQAKNIGLPNPAPRGLHLTIKPGNARGTAIKYALEAVGIPVTVSAGDTGAFDIQMTIGLKP